MNYLKLHKFVYYRINTYVAAGLIVIIAIATDNKNGLPFLSGTVIFYIFFTKIKILIKIKVIN